MNKISDIPANLSTNLKNSLDYYKNIFNYQNILLLNISNENIKVLIQTEKEEYSKFGIKNTFKIKDSVYKKQNISKQLIQIDYQTIFKKKKKISKIKKAI